MGHLRPVLATRYTSHRGLLEFSRQSLEKLSEKGYEQRSDRELGGIRRPKWTEKYRFGGP